MVVYRVEHEKDGRGPYNGFCEIIEIKCMCGKHSRDTINHPTPYIDTTNYILGVEHCGFESMESLHSWFSSQELLNMKAVGFALKIYNCPDDKVRKGAKQLVFQKQFSELIATTDLN